MDDQTRFSIAQELADRKFAADLRPLFQQGKQIARKQLYYHKWVVLIQNAGKKKDARIFPTVLIR